MFFDKIAKAITTALDPLASLLDDHHTLTPVLAEIHFRAHPEFLFCAAQNQDEEEGLGLPVLDERRAPGHLRGLSSTKGNRAHLESEFAQNVGYLISLPGVLLNSSDSHLDLPYLSTTLKGHPGCEQSCQHFIH